MSYYRRNSYDDDQHRTVDRDYFRREWDDRVRRSREKNDSPPHRHNAYYDRSREPTWTRKNQNEFSASASRVAKDIEDFMELLNALYHDNVTHQKYRLNMVRASRLAWLEHIFVTRRAFYLAHMKRGDPENEEETFLCIQWEQMMMTKVRTIRGGGGPEELIAEAHRPKPEIKELSESESSEEESEEEEPPAKKARKKTKTKVTKTKTKKKRNKEEASSAAAAFLSPTKMSLRSATRNSAPPGKGRRKRSTD